MKFTNSATVIPVVLTPHPNADSLSLVDVGGVNVVVKTAEWAGENKGVYIPPENYVDTTQPELTFLGNGQPVRVKAAKLRGVYSFGLLLKCRDGMSIGDDVTNLFCLEHYDPEPSPVDTGWTPPSTQMKMMPKYDVDSHHKIKGLIGQEVVEVTEKIHGQNASYYWMDGQVICRARRVWVPRDGREYVWRAFYVTPGIEFFLQNNPDYVLFGEVYGHVKNYRYDAPVGGAKFRCFDIRRLSDFGYLNGPERRELCEKFNVPHVPISYVGVHDFEYIKNFGVGQSLLNSHTLREGCVVKPEHHIFDHGGNRVMYKFVNPEYLSK